MQDILYTFIFPIVVGVIFYRVGATKTAIRYKTTRQFVYFWVHQFEFSHRDNG